MKALILAAGLGSRLAPITDNIPKSLVSVNGKPILIKQIENLLENNVKDITIVSGYKAQILEKAVFDKYPFVKVVENHDYAITNNMYSAYIGIKQMGLKDEFLMMNADVFYDSSVLKSLLSFKCKDAIVVDIGRYLEESMKVVEHNGKIIKISKQILANESLGSSIDVYKFSQEAGTEFYNKCREYINNGDLQKWSEVALNDILSSQNFKACPLNGRWFEIDNHEDLALAEKIFKD